MAARGGVDEDLPRATDLAQPTAPARIRNREIELLPRPLEGPFAQPLIPAAPVYGHHFALHVNHCLDEVTVVPLGKSLELAEGDWRTPDLNCHGERW
jgi:hypothetical protein